MYDQQLGLGTGGAEVLLKVRRIAGNQTPACAPFTGGRVRPRLQREIRLKSTLRLL